jgi:hypothetical protein
VLENKEHSCFISQNVINAEKEFYAVFRHLAEFSEVAVVRPFRRENDFLPKVVKQNELEIRQQ